MTTLWAFHPIRVCPSTGSRRRTCSREAMPLRRMTLMLPTLTTLRRPLVESGRAKVGRRRTPVRLRRRRSASQGSLERPPLEERVVVAEEVPRMPPPRGCRPFPDSCLTTVTPHRQCPTAWVQWDTHPPDLHQGLTRWTCTAAQWTFTAVHQAWGLGR